MTVRELLEILSKAPYGAQVIVSSDAEGNEWRSLEDVTVCRAEQDGYEWYQTTESAGSRDKQVVVLWP